LQLKRSESHGDFMPKISTIHVGSLARGNVLMPLLLARDQGKPRFLEWPGEASVRG
jgi:hypothetical protein